MLPSIILTLLQITGFVVSHSQSVVSPSTPVRARWAAHKWSLVEVCGHTVQELNCYSPALNMDSTQFSSLLVRRACSILTIQFPLAQS